MTKKSDERVCRLMVGHDRKAGSNHQELETMMLGNMINGIGSLGKVIRVIDKYKSKKKCILSSALPHR